MRLTRITVTTAAIGLLAAMAAAAPAQAAEVTASADQATAVAERIGSAGAYLDDAGRMVVTVTDASEAQAVRAAGALPRYVEHSLNELRSATGALNARAKIPGTTWAIDPRTNRVEVTYDSTVNRSELAQLKSVTRTFGDAVRVTKAAGRLSMLVSGGEAIYSGGSRCSLGFNVQRGSTQYFITAGHCTNIGASWYGPTQSQFLGTRAGSSFPGNDYGIVRYENSVSRPGNVYLYNGSYQDITGAGNAVVGQSVRRSGSTTGVHGGSVTATNATVNYPQGTVTGLIRTNVCAEPGDSGGSMWSGSTALGLTSGGSGNCIFGGTTYFQPVPEVLNVYGVSIY